MFKLRQTWSELFPNKKLYALDVRVHHIDPAWPITAKPPETGAANIHVNPRFLIKVFDLSLYGGYLKTGYPFSKAGNG